MYLAVDLALAASLAEGNLATGAGPVIARYLKELSKAREA
jgi:hypothetical protein